MQSFHRLSFLPLCLSLYLLLLGRKGLNVTAQDQREKRSVGLQAGGGRLFTLLSVTLLCSLKLFSRIIISSKVFVSG